MTTKVTVDAHAGWSVRVEAFDPSGENEDENEVVIVRPGTVETFYIHSTKALFIEELSSSQLGEIQDE